MTANAKMVTEGNSMKFVAGQGVWHLVDEIARDCTRVIATLNDEVEILALRKFCDLYLNNSDNLPSQFEIQHQGKPYKVYFLANPGQKLTLHVVGDDGKNAS